MSLFKAAVHAYGLFRNVTLCHTALNVQTLWYQIGCIISH